MADSITYLLYTFNGVAQFWYDDETLYTSQVKNDISMVMVRTEHVDKLLTLRCGCGDCGQNKRACLRPASMQEILEWNK